MKIYMITNNNQKTTPDERGFASIVIALTLVIILALMTVGFAQLARREQRSALNKQLATQAYYAAETGIEDARADILSGKIQSSNSNCTQNFNPAATDVKLRNPEINKQLGVSYGCVSIDLNPTSLVYTGVSDSSFRNAVFTNANPTVIDSLTISWTSADGQSSPPANKSGGFKDQPTWTTNGYPALMEASVTAVTNVDRDNMIYNNMTSYGYPVTGPTVPAIYGLFIGTGGSNASPEQGLVRNAHCDAVTKSCSMVISNLISSAGAPIVMHLTSHYDKSNITVTGKDVLGNAVKFAGAQVVVDSTGRARDVLKRLQAHLTLDGAATLPNYAVESQSVCKRLATYPNVSGGSTDDYYQSSLGLGSIAVPGDPCYLN